MVGDILLVFGPPLIGIYAHHWLFLLVSLWLIDDSLCDSYLMSDIVGVAGATCDGATCMVLCEPGKMAIGRRRTKCRWNRKSGFFWKRVSLRMKLNPRFAYDPVSKSHDLSTIYPRWSWHDPSNRSIILKEDRAFWNRWLYDPQFNIFSNFQFVKDVHPKIQFSTIQILSKHVRLMKKIRSVFLTEFRDQRT